jgi:hypothetical protein
MSVWLIIAARDEVGTSMISRAFARWYIQGSDAGGIALSLPVTGGTRTGWPSVPDDLVTDVVERFTDALDLEQPK